MPQNNAGKTPNRVHEDLSAWERQQSHYTKRYGSSVWNNRESLKVQQGIYKQILRKYAFKRMSPEERMEYKMLQGQVRAIDKKLYPNPIIRAARNSFILIGNLLKLGGKLALMVPREMFAALTNPRYTTRPAEGQVSQQQQETRQYFRNNRPVPSRNQQGPKNDKQQNEGQQAVVKQMTSSKPRSMTPETPGQGLHI